MLRIIGRTLAILLVAGIIGGITFGLVQLMGGQTAAAAIQNFGGPGGPRGGSVMGLGQVLLNAVELAAIVGVAYPLQRWWLARQPARPARVRRAGAAA